MIGKEVYIIYNRDDLKVSYDKSKDNKPTRKNK